MVSGAEERDLERRLELVQKGLAERGLPALLVTDRVSIAYLTGYDTEWWKNPSRRRVCWVPADGEPTIVTVGGEAGAAEAVTPWRVRDAGGPSATETRIGDFPVINFESDLARCAVEVGRELGLDGAAAVGLPMGAISRVEVPLMVLDAIREGLSIGGWTDVAGLLYGLRARKSEHELETMRQAVRTLDLGFERVFAELEAGIDERDLARRLRGHVVLAGAENPAFTEAFADARSLYTVDEPGPIPTTLTPGSVAFLDGGGIVNGYWSDYDRLFAIGEATPKQRDAYAAVARAHHEAIAAIRPGMTASELAALLIDRLAEVGFTEYPVRRMGHGIGLEMPEPPFLHLDDHTILEEGMVICVEPNAYVPGVGVLVVEDEIVVRADGCENLSTSPTPLELPLL